MIDLIFYRNVSIELICQLEYGDIHNSDHTPIIFKVEDSIPILNKPRYDYKLLHDNIDIRLSFKNEMRDVLNKNIDINKL